MPATGFALADHPMLAQVRVSVDSVYGSPATPALGRCGEREELNVTGEHQATAIVTAGA